MRLDRNVKPVEKIDPLKKLSSEIKSILNLDATDFSIHFTSVNVLHVNNNETSNWNRSKTTEYFQIETGLVVRKFRSEGSTLPKFKSERTCYWQRTIVNDFLHRFRTASAGLHFWCYSCKQFPSFIKLFLCTMRVETSWLLKKSYKSKAASSQAIVSLCSGYATC